MDYKTISQMMMEDISMADTVEEYGIPLIRYGVRVPVQDLRKAAESKSFRCHEANRLYLTLPWVGKLVDQFFHTCKNNDELGTRKDVVHYLANCLSIINNIELSVEADIMNFEYLALESMKHHTVVVGEYMHLVQSWCRNNDCLDLLPNMTAFVFCRAVQIKRDKEKK